MGNFQWRRKTVDGWQSLRPIWADGAITPNVAWLAWDHRAGYRPSSPQPAPEVNRKQSQHWELAEDWPSQLRAERTWPLAPHRLTFPGNRRWAWTLDTAGVWAVNWSPELPSRGMWWANQTEGPRRTEIDKGRNRWQTYFIAESFLRS